MALTLPSRKTLALTLAGLAVFYLLFAWLALPRIIQSQAEKFIAEKTGHRLTMDRPEFNPFKNSLRLTGLRLARPDGEPLLAFRELVVDMSVASIFRGAFVFDGIHLDGLEATVVMQPDGRNNWSALLDALKSKEKTPGSALPRLDIHHLVLAGARLDFTDMWTAPVFATRIEPINLELTDISTLSDDKGRFKVAARTIYGARVTWQGKASLEPPVVTGSISVEDVDIARLATYIKDVLPIAPPAGIFGVSADYRFAYAGGRPELNLEHITAKLTGLRLQGNRDSDPSVAVDSIEAKEGRFDLVKNSFTLGNISATGGRLNLERGKDGSPKALELGSLALDDVRVDLATHLATLGRVALKDGSVRVTRDAMGRIDILQTLQSVSSPAPAKPAAKKETANAPAEPGWRYRVEKLELTKFGAALREESVTPAAELALEDITLDIEGISDDWKAAVPLQSSFKIQGGGNFEAEGKVVPAGPTADIRIKLAALNLAPAQPYLSAVAKLKLVKGQLSSEGRASYNAKGSGYRGSFALRDVRLNEAESGNLFMAWNSLGSRAFEVTPTKLDIGELAVIGLDTKLIINKDKSVSITRILRPKAAAASKPAEQQSAAAGQARPFLVDIDRLRVSKSAMDFADNSLALPFATRIHDLRGVVTGISSRPGAPSQLELDGEVDDYGLARAVGQVDLFNPTDFMDLKVVFRNIEMTRLTPYSATFAGRKITSGKLSLDLEYKMKHRQLQGENQVIMDQLTLGERVESPEAINLPLDLAIAILQDSDGRIDLGLPVSGSLDDPQFSYSRIIWKAIVNVLTKIVTAPFRALGALFGSDEKFEDISFEAGDAQLTPPEREKLVRLAGILVKRPRLSLALQGAYAESDRAALQDRQVRRAVIEKSGQQVEGDSDPGPISTRQPKVQAALEKLYSERFGSAELAALKQGFREANPGQLEESTAGKLISRLSGLFREKRKLSEQEVTRLKGTDFYTVLFERLRDRVVVDNERLLALASARGEATATALKAAGVPPERLAVLPAEKVETEGKDIPVKLVLGAAGKTPVPAAAGTTAN
ncbi:MAG: DUF748 domain-containing protein [Gallionellaceae bacterium]